MTETNNGPAILAAIRTIMATLVRAGVHDLSPWWWALLERFYLHATALTLTVCAGRGADKTRTSVIMGIAELIAGGHIVPPGERHYHVHVAENLGEAGKTLRLYEEYFRLLGIRFTRSGDTLDLVDLPLGAKILASRVGAVSGFRVVGWTCDEAALWSDEGADPSAEVVTSIKGMGITHRYVRGRMLSKPLGALGFFYETWRKGDTADQVAAHAASWEANAGVTEEQCRILYPDPRVFDREARALPQAGVIGACDPAQVARVPRTLHAYKALGSGVLFLDSSAGKGDEWAWAIGGHLLEFGEEPPGTGPLVETHVCLESTFDPTPLVEGRVLKHALREEVRIARAAHDERTLSRFWEREARLGWIVPEAERDVQRRSLALSGICATTAHARGHDGPPPPTEQRRILYVSKIGAIAGAFGTVVPFDEAVARAAYVARHAGITRCFGDQFQSFALASEFRKHGIEYVELAWTAATKVQAAGMLRSMLAAGTLAAEPGAEAERMCADLCELQEVILPSGALTISAKRTRRGHGDRGSVALLICRAESEGLIAGSPIEKQRGVISIDPETGESA